MTGAEFAELVEWVWDRWGRSDEVWANPDRFQADFANLESEDVWAALYTVGKGQWAPRPPELTDGAREQMRNRLRPERQAALPSPKGAPWSEWCMEKFGEKRTFEDVVRERHAELTDCRSPICDVHRGTA